MRTALALAVVCFSSSAWAGSAASLQAFLALDAPPSATPHITVERMGPQVRGVVADVVPHPVNHVLNDIIMCYSAFPEWFPYQTGARFVTDIVDESAVIYGEITLPWPIGRRDFEARITGQVEAHPSGSVYRLDFQHVKGSGNIAMMEGSWRVQALGEAETLVHYDATIDFDTWVPAFLLARGTEQFLPKITGNMTDRGSACANPQAGVPRL